MCKKDLIKEISQKGEFYQKDVAKVIDIMAEVIGTALAGGDNVNVTGFGKFVPLDKKATTRRNPRTGETINVPAKRVPKFKASTGFKAAVAGA